MNKLEGFKRVEKVTGVCDKNKQWAILVKLSLGFNQGRSFLRLFCGGIQTFTKTMVLLCAGKMNVVSINFQICCSINYKMRSWENEQKKTTTKQHKRRVLFCLRSQKYWWSVSFCFSKRSSLQEGESVITDIFMNYCQAFPGSSSSS